MRSEDIQSGDVCRLKQDMKIGDEVTCRAWHRNGGAPAQMIRIEERSRPVITANTGELGDTCKNRIHPRLELGVPNVGFFSVTRLEHHRRAARAMALEVELPARAHVCNSGNIARR